MNFIPVDRSVVSELHAQGRALYNGILPVTSLDDACEAANRGTLYTRSLLTETELVDYISVNKEIKRLQEIKDEYDKRLIEDAEVSLVDRKFRTYEISGLPETIQVVKADRITIIPEQGERAYKLLSQCEALLEKVTSYSASTALKTAIKIITFNDTLEQPIETLAAELIKTYKLDTTPDKFLKKIGKAYATRCAKLVSVFGLPKVDAINYAYMLSSATNAVTLEEVLSQVGSTLSAKDRKELASCFAVSETVSVKILEG